MQPSASICVWRKLCLFAKHIKANGKGTQYLNSRKQYYRLQKQEYVLWFRRHETRIMNSIFIKHMYAGRVRNRKQQHHEKRKKNATCVVSCHCCTEKHCVRIAIMMTMITTGWRKNTVIVFFLVWLRLDASIRMRSCVFMQRSCSVLLANSHMFECAKLGGESIVCVCGRITCYANAYICMNNVCWTMV